MDEWGEYTIDAAENICIQSNGVIEAIQNNNPAIASILVEAFEENSQEEDEEDEIPRFDWAAAGACLGNSETVKHLELRVNEFDSRQNIRIFCTGLVVNRSIQHLVIRCGLEEDGFGQNNNRVVETLTDELFKDLHPFFEHNTQLDSIEFEYCSDNCYFVAGIREALESRSALKAIKLIAHASQYRNDEELDKLIKVICMKQGLRHISLEGCVLSKLSCLDLKNMLCRNGCSLKSLKLRYVDTKGEDAKEIACGMTGNNSLKYLHVEDIEEEDGTGHVLTAILNAPTSLSTIEVLFLGDGIRLNDSLEAVLKHATNLTSLTLDSCTESLHQTQVVTLPLTIRVLELPRWMNIRKKDLPSIFDLLPTVALLELRLGRIDGDLTMMSLCKYLAFNERLRILKIASFDNITPEGWRAFSSILQSSEIEELAVKRGSIDQLVAALAPSLNLKRLNLQIEQFCSLQVLANSLARSDSQLEELKVSYFPTETDPTMDAFFMDSETWHALLAITMISALERNSTLKVLHVRHSIGSGFDWQSHFYDLLCNGSSIDQTNQSNHTIESLMFGQGGMNLSVKLFSMLHLNSKYPDKKAVAREKIIRQHNVECINFEPQALPHVLSCVGSSGSPRLSLVYGILRRMPHVIQKCNKKRKASDIET